VKRVLILGRGASGKSTLASRLSEVTGLPVIELDKIFWQSGLNPMPRPEWVITQQKLVSQIAWIMDGDLGSYDALDVRLQAADSIVLLDFPLRLCAWRALKRSRERGDFWLWMVLYRWRSLPSILRLIGKQAPDADLYLLRSPHEVKEFVERLSRQFLTHSLSANGVKSAYRTNTCLVPSHSEPDSRPL